MLQMAVRGEEVQLSRAEGLFQVVQELAPEHLRQHSHWQKEARPAGNPMFAVRRDATSRDEKMNMWMVQQVLSPRMQYAEETDLCSEMFWIGGDGAQRFRRGLK
jgi:hypothetical protein